MTLSTIFSAVCQQDRLNMPLKYQRMKTNRDQDVLGVAKYGPMVIGGVMVAFIGPQPKG